MTAYEGLHPAIGALDVCPLVWLDPADRDAATAEARSRRRADRRARRPGLPLRRAGHRPRAPRARLLPQRRPRRALAADGERRAAPRPRPAAAAPDAPARPWSPPARRWPPSTSSSTAATSRSPAPSPPACASRAAACPGVRAIGLALGSGRGQVSTNVHDPLGDAARRSSSSGCGSWRRRSAPARSRPSWSASCPRRRSPATRRTCRSAASTPPGRRSSGASRRSTARPAATD